MKVLKYALLGIAAIIGLVLLVALFVPKDYKVVRTVSINAPQALVMDQAKSLKKMNEWSPFIEEDPNVQITYSGTEGQVGSSSSWKSEKIGEGSQTITSLTNERMEAALAFVKPMESKANAFFEAKNDGSAVKATWGMTGRNPYPFNIMCLFMDNMIGGQYEKGLAKLKMKCEQQASGTTVSSK